VVTISIGGAVLVPDENGDANRLVQAADTGLYQAKRNGRNQVVMV
jgi:two-component system chemotaxis family response regulator WspR